MESKDNSKPTTPLHGNHNHHHEDVIKVSIYSDENVSIIYGERAVNNLFFK